MAEAFLLSAARTPIGKYLGAFADVPAPDLGAVAVAEALRRARVSPDRVDEVIIFRSLTKEDLKRIIDIELAKVSKRLAEKNMKIVLSDEAKELIIEKGSSLDFGARPLRRAIENLLEDPLAEDLLRGSFVGKDTIHVRVGEVDGQKKLIFEPTSTTPELVGAGSETKG